jgi:hypothetical protein
LRTAPKPPSSQDDRSHLSSLAQKIVSHYAEFYRVKSMAIESDVLSVFTAPWASCFERSLHWIAGWRPTTLFHLVYTESSILFEFHIADILKGRSTGDLGDLSPNQFRFWIFTFYVYSWYLLTFFSLIIVCDLVNTCKEKFSYNSK